MKLYRVVANRPEWLQSGPEVTAYGLSLEQAEQAVKDAHAEDWGLLWETYEGDFNPDGTPSDPAEWSFLLNEYGYRGWRETRYEIESYCNTSGAEPDLLDGEGDFTRVSVWAFADKDGPTRLKTSGGDATGGPLFAN